MNLNEQDFQNMNTQYDIQKRNNSRLIIFDDRFALTLWRRLKFSHRITKLIPNTKPFGFNVQGTWGMCGVNTAMRLNITKVNILHHIKIHNMHPVVTNDHYLVESFT
ncbi:unnamed protein product [Rotaria socialis]|uniref:Uncharacterized protein n=1 Tax=Rotaria socialis TaxID=392032 RepID=A0A818B7P4_9BILA|nr:unnamed protein product [Rotaria socialis]